MLPDLVVWSISGDLRWGRKVPQELFKWIGDCGQVTHDWAGGAIENHMQKYGGISEGYMHKFSQSQKIH